MAKIITKISSFTDVQKSLQALERQLNALNNAVNSSPDTGIKDSEGKTGDIKTVRTPNKSYEFKVKSKEGWVSPVISRPDYDSGWVSVSDGQTTGIHNLGSIPLHQQIWWSDDNGTTVHKPYSSNANSFSLELTSSTWQITGSTYYGSVCLNGLGAGGSGSTLSNVDYSGWKLKVLLWK